MNPIYTKLSDTKQKEMLSELIDIYQRNETIHKKEDIFSLDLFEMQNNKKIGAHYCLDDFHINNNKIGFITDYEKAKKNNFYEEN